MNEIGKQGLSLATRGAAFSRFVGLLERFGDRRTDLLRVLMYHRVDQRDAHPELNPGLLSATPEDFDRQMRFLAAHYHVISIDELLDVSRHKHKLPPRSVLITFDDAYRGFEEIAWPILKRYDLPVTLFVPTAFPDQPDRCFWWDRLYQAVREARSADYVLPSLGRLPFGTAKARFHAFRRMCRHVKSLPHEEGQSVVERIWDDLDARPSANHVSGWDTLRRLAREGVTLAPHTRSHPLMNRISLEDAREEALGSVRDLQREIGPVPPILAYPAGGHTEGVARMLEREGFEFAFTVTRGANDLRTVDRLRLRRIDVGRRTSQAVLRAQLLPCLAYFKRWMN